MKKAKTAISLIILCIFAGCMLFPIYWTVKGSFEQISSIMKIPPDFILRNATLWNYETLFFNFPVFRWTLNSLIITLATTIIVVSTSCLSGYAFGKKDFPGKNILFWLLLSTMMIPFHVTIIPLFIQMKRLGLLNTYPGVFLPMCGSAGFMFLARQYMSTIPSELLDSARVDGASEFSIFMIIIVPISKPLIAALSIFTFVAAWGNFLWALIMTSKDATRTLPVGIVCAAARIENLSDMGIALAGATLVAIPIIIIFFCFQKYFTKGITLGAIKG